jgi:hypothetical protein
MPALPYGLILGAVPDVVADATLVLPDYLEQGAGCGFKREQYYWALMGKCLDKAGFHDFCNGRPFDATSLGEFGRLNNRGMGFFLDPHEVFIRCDETSGLFLYYQDRFVRLAGYNFQHETAGSEWCVKNDEGEVVNEHGTTPYAWEAAGLFDATKPATREVDEFDVQYLKPYASLEPVEDDQQAFYRYEMFGGYNGQGFMRHLMLPPQEPPAVNRYSGKEIRPGVFREQVSLDGAYSLTSAHSFSISKRMLIPIPSVSGCGRPE